MEPVVSTFMTRILFLLPFRSKKTVFSEAKKQFSRIKFFFGGRPPNLHFLTGWDLQRSKHLAEFRFGIFIKKGDWGIDQTIVTIYKHKARGRHARHTPEVHTHRLARNSLGQSGAGTLVHPPARGSRSPGARTAGRRRGRKRPRAQRTAVRLSTTRFEHAGHGCCRSDFP